MKMRFTVFLPLMVLFGLLVFGYVLLRSAPQGDSPTEEDIAAVLSLPDSPLDATYKVGEHELKLQKGTISTDTGVFSVLGEPYYGDLNGNGYDDAVLIFSYEGDVAKQYMGVALQNERGFIGLETVPLSRGEPLGIEVQNEYISLSYTPTQKALSHIEFERYVVSGIELREVELLDENMLYVGSIYTQGDSLYFAPCMGAGLLEGAIAQEAPSYAALKAIYHEKKQREPSLSRFGVVVAGSKVDVEYVFTTIVSAPKTLTCPNVPLVPFEEPALPEEESLVDHTSPQ